MDAEWKVIKPWGAHDATLYWINGIYKIVSYDDGEYYAFFIQDAYKNWGDYVSPPPDNGVSGKCWKSLDNAKHACLEHSSRHTPKPKTVKRAAEILASLVAQENEHNQRAEAA